MRPIELRGIRRAFALGEEVLHGIDLDVEEGQIVGLLGRNGAGKTTLLRIALGLLEPNAGTVRLFGMDPRKHPLEVKRRVGYVSEEQVLPGLSSVSDVLDIHRALFPKWDRQLEVLLTKRFALSPDARIATLSKGQARQVAILCAVAHRPELLLLDEPAGGLDPAARREFLEVALELLRSEGTTIVFSSHHMADVERIAERVVLVHGGRKVIDADIDSLRETYTLAIAEETGAVRESLRATDGYLSSRSHDGALRAVFADEPSRVQATLGGRLGNALVRCDSVPLEELFIEVVEGTP